MIQQTNPLLTLAWQRPVGRSGIRGPPQTVREGGLARCGDPGVGQGARRQPLLPGRSCRGGGGGQAASGAQTALQAPGLSPRGCSLPDRVAGPRPGVPDGSRGAPTLTGPGLAAAPQPNGPVCTDSARGVKNGFWFALEDFLARSLGCGP